MDELAEIIGVVPSLFKNWKVWKPLLFGPIWPCQYRLEGPGAWAGAEEAMHKAYAQISERPEKEASSYWLDEEEEENEKSGGKGKLEMKEKSGQQKKDE